MLVECAPAERQRVGRCIWPISLVGWVFRRLSLRLLFVFFLVLTASPLSAQGHAVLDPGRSEVRPGWFGRSLALDLALSEPVPFRVFTLDAPPRLVVDLAGVDPQDAAGASVSGATADSLRIGRIGPGWARLVLALPGPLAIETAELVQDERAGQRLEVRLGRVSPEAFAAAAGAPPGVWPAGAPARAAPGVSGQKGLLVALDPGHGGIDPGAVREGVAEKDVVLAFAEALRTSLLAAGFRVMLTREGDDFVALDARTAMAAADGADVFLSIHSNAVADPAVAGAIAFTLSERGSTSAAASRAAAENAADRVAGLGAGLGCVGPGGTGRSGADRDGRPCIGSCPYPDRPPRARGGRPAGPAASVGELPGAGDGAPARRPARDRLSVERRRSGPRGRSRVARRRCRRDHRGAPQFAARSVRMTDR